MFETNSRYYGIPETSIVFNELEGGEHKIVYKRRRFLPPLAEDTGTFVEHIVTQGERLDNITARYIGDPTQFWRICDVNLILEPDELTDEIGRSIKIAILHL
jgi:hypothetical protein